MLENKKEVLYQQWWNNNENQAMVYSPDPENQGWGYFLSLESHPGDQPLGMLSGMWKALVPEHLIGYPQGSDQRKTIFQKKASPPAALAVIHITSAGLTLENKIPG